MSKKLTINHVEQVKYGGDVERQLGALDKAVAASFRKVQEWMNRYAPAEPGPVFTVDAFASSGEFANKSYMVHLIETTEPWSFLLPPIQKDFLLVVKDSRGLAATNPITLVRNGGVGAIDGVSADLVINTDNAVVWLISDGPDGQGWWTL